ncbi:MAG: cation:proton antiporter [SAR202 cluster bacterium]|jgi:Kef-type K+ transport system membrane component KefB|nr:cation:proton antiporter [SAR202 cluster bacterium]MDP6514390.1 cation:proton antiporter [SAR202 cluster bacterium]MDP6713411.1 cation:proton antiporter [SAR202 cluster bacterium]
MEPLFQLTLIWVGTFAAIVVAKATRLTAVVYFLAVGAILVNLGWLPEEADPFVKGLADVGIIIIMFALGFEENTNNFIQSIKQSWGIAFFGGLAPFLTAFSLAFWFWSDLNLALMVGLAMTATAVSLTMVSLRSEGLHASPVATRIMTSAVLDDVASLALVAVLIPVVTGDGSVGVTDIGLIAGKTVLFFLVVTFIGAWVFPHNTSGWLQKVPLMNRLGVRNILTFSEGEFSTLIVLTLALIVSLIAHEFGFHVAVGAYMAGLILKEEYFHLDANGNSYEATKRIIDDVAFTWIGPVFFVLLGANLIFDWDIIFSIIPQSIALVAALFFAQVTSAGLAARYTGGLTTSASLMVGLGMLGRAELAFVVMDIAYVEHSVLNDAAFYTLMITAFWLNLAVPITIRLWKPYYVRSMQERS